MQKKPKKQVDKTTNIIFYGVGGQGVLTASELCGRAAVIDGFHVKKSEVHGMAQRGGSVESHLRFGRAVYSPLISEGKADFLVCLHASEHLRLKHFLSRKGVDLISDLHRGESFITDRKYLNSFMLGVLSKHLVITEESWLKALDILFGSKRFIDNKEAFLLGRK